MYVTNCFALSFDARSTPTLIFAGLGGKRRYSVAFKSVFNVFPPKIYESNSFYLIDGLQFRSFSTDGQDPALDDHENDNESLKRDDPNGGDKGAVPTGIVDPAEQPSDDPLGNGKSSTTTPLKGDSATVLASIEELKKLMAQQPKGNGGGDGASQAPPGSGKGGKDTEPDPKDMLGYDPSTFNLLVDSQDLVKDSSELYEERIKLNGKTTVPNKELVHFKSRANAKHIAANNEMSSLWLNSLDLYRLYIRGVARATKGASPVDGSYLQSLQIAIMAMSRNISSPMFQLARSMKHIASRCVYGYSHGAYDLVHFTESNWSRFELEVIFKTRGEDPNFQIILKFLDDKGNLKDTITTSLSIRSFDLSGVSYDVSKLIRENSGFDSSQYEAIMSSFYKISGSIKVGLLFKSQSERVVTLVRTFKEQISYGDGFSSTHHTTDGLQLPAFGTALVFQLSALFLFDNFGYSKEVKHQMLQYVAVSIYEYVVKLTPVTENNNINFFKFTFKMERNVANENLHNEFVNLINEGLFMPITPIHYRKYLWNDLKDLWDEIIFLSTISVPSYNHLFASALPIISYHSKHHFFSYALDHNKLTSSFYMPDVATPWQKSNEFHITFRDFVLEMYVRTMLSEPLPNYLYPISDGSWNFGIIQTSSISPCSVNPIICKFNLNQPTNNINELISDMLMLTPGYTNPYYIKRTARLSEHLPNVYHRFVPYSDVKLSDNENRGRLTGHKSVGVFDATDV